MCSLVHDDASDFNWEYEHTEDDFEMPPGGHILVDANYHSPGEKAIISTPNITVQGLQCASFWYERHFQYFIFDLVSSCLKYIENSRDSSLRVASGYWLNVVFSIEL